MKTLLVEVVLVESGCPGAVPLMMPIVTLLTDVVVLLEEWPSVVEEVEEIGAVVVAFV